MFLQVFTLVELGVSLYSLYVFEKEFLKESIPILKITVKLLNTEAAHRTSMVRLQNKLNGLFLTAKF